VRNTGGASAGAVAADCMVGLGDGGGGARERVVALARLFSASSRLLCGSEFCYYYSTSYYHDLFSRNDVSQIAFEQKIINMIMFPNRFRRQI
jgi:hypothetical protein